MSVAAGQLDRAAYLAFIEAKVKSAVPESNTSFDPNRDDVLTPDDRVTSAQKCLDLLASEIGSMTDKESTFVNDMLNRIRNFGQVSERQLAWLRDLVEKYAQ